MTLRIWLMVSFERLLCRPSNSLVGTLGAGVDSLRYSLPVNLNGVYDVSVKVKSRVQVNEFVNFTGNLHITVDGGLGLNAEIPSKTHNYHNTHEAVLNFLRKGLAISPGASHIDFSTEVTGSNSAECSLYRRREYDHYRYLAGERWQRQSVYCGLGRAQGTLRTMYPTTS